MKYMIHDSFICRFLKKTDNWLVVKTSEIKQDIKSFNDYIKHSEKNQHDYNTGTFRNFYH